MGAIARIPLLVIPRRRYPLVAPVGLEFRAKLPRDPGVASAQDDLVTELTDLLGDRYPDALDAAMDIIDSGALGDELDVKDVPRIIAALRHVMIDGWTDDVKDPVVNAVDDVYGIGREGPLDDLGLDADWNDDDDRVQGALGEDAQYWVGDAWDNQLEDSVEAHLRAEVLDVGGTRREAGGWLEGLFDKLLPAMAGAYFGLVAASSLVRTRTYGNLESFKQARVHRYMWLHPPDSPDQICPVCEYLNRKVFPLDAALAQRDAWVDAGDPDARVDAAPWLPRQAVLDLANVEAMVRAGVLAPPAHGHCDCELKLLLGDVSRDEADDDGGDGGEGAAGADAGEADAE